MKKAVAARICPEITKLMNVLVHSDVIPKNSACNIMRNFIEGNDTPLKNFIENVNAENSNCQQIVNSIKELTKGVQNE